MARRKPSAPNVKKFGAPLYASAWIDDRVALVASGGGKKSSGIPNRVMQSSFDSVEQAKKFLCARAPPSAAAIEEALREARQGDEADSEEDEETRAARVRTTALAKDDAGYFGFVG